MRAPGPWLGIAGGKQRQQGHDAAFAAVVGAQDQQRVFDRNDQDQRPEDQRNHTEDGVMRQSPAMAGGLGGFLQGIKGAGADVAVDDAEGADRGCRGKRTGMAGGCSWRTGHWRAPIGTAPAGSSGGTRSIASLRRDAPNYHEDYASKRSVQTLRTTESKRPSRGILRASIQSNLEGKQCQNPSPTGSGRRSPNGLRGSPPPWCRQRAGRKLQNSARPAASSPCRPGGRPAGQPWRGPAAR